MTPVVSGRSWVRFLVGFVALYGVLWAAGSVDTSARWGLGMLAVVVLAAVLVETLLFRTPVPALPVRLGFGRPAGRALALGALVSGGVLLVYPLTAAVTGVSMQLRPDWLWLLIGVFAFHGLAEEMLWRGYVFGRLRAGRSFWSAVGWTMPLIAVTHLPIVFSMGPVTGIGAMVVAAVTSIPLGYLYETGRGTVWAPALVHTAIDSFKLFVIPASVLSTFPMLITVISIVVPLAALAVPRQWLERADHPGKRNRPPFPPAGKEALRGL